MTKLTDKQKKKIIADYVENQNFKETARMNNVNASTVKRLCDSNYDNVQQKAIQKKEENTLSTIEYMETQHQKKKNIIDKLLNSMEILAEDVDKASLKELATAYGIILDKELKVLELKNQKVNLEELTKVDELLKEIRENADK